MPSYTQRAVNNFTKGLITESGELTFPENASVDECNCDLFRDGSRRRRKAIAIEDNAEYSTFSVTSSVVTTFDTWPNVGLTSDKTYLVVQVGNILRFYEKTIQPFSGQEVAGSVSLVPYQVAGKSAALAQCQFTTVLGALVVVSEAIEPIYIEETSVGVFSVTQVEPKVRDFKWLGDKDTYTENETSPGDERKYDTYNAGWSSDVLTVFQNTQGATLWPRLTHPSYSGKDASDNFDYSTWNSVYSGTSLIGNGRIILDLFNKDRATPTGLSIDNEVELTRFTTAESFSGRVFFAGLKSPENAGRIYFSELMQSLSNIGRFHQQNDPTSETFSDLLETDGGVIVIPAAVNIKKLFAFRNSMFVFAENGVWQIKGIDNVFSPTAYSVSRITEVGMVTPGSFVSAEGVPFWWSRNGIHTLSFDEYGNAIEQSVSVETIQSFWEDIDSNAKGSVQATYDAINKKILWLYKNNGEVVTNKFNRLLILDVPLQAFYPWKFEDDDDQYVIGFSYYSGFGTIEEEVNVVNGSDNVVNGSDNVVTVVENPLSNSSIDVVFMVRNSSTSLMTMALVNGDSFLDWGTQNYLSYAETGYDFLGDLVLKKNAPYIVFYMRETETGWTGSEETGYEPTHPSSLLVSAYWDYRKTASSTAQQAYRRTPVALVDTTDLSDFGSNETVVTSRLKLRGRGRNMRVRLESEEGKDFIYLGHGIVGEISDGF